MREPFAHPVGGTTGFVGQEMASRNRRGSLRSGPHAAFWARAHMNALRVIPPTERDVLEKPQRARSRPSGKPAWRRDGLGIFTGLRIRAEPASSRKIRRTMPWRGFRIVVSRAKHREHACHESRAGEEGSSWRSADPSERRARRQPTSSRTRAFIIDPLALLPDRELAQSFQSIQDRHNGAGRKDTRPRH
jgi:hypothetical protein